MVRPRRLTADQDRPQRAVSAARADATLPRPIPASYYARPAPPAPAPAGARTAARDLQRRWMGLGLIGVLVVLTALLALLGRGLLSKPEGARPDVVAPPPLQVAGPVATDPPTAAPVAVRSPSSTPRPTPSATPRRTPAPASVAFLNAPLSVHRGDSPTLEVRTTPVTTCTIDLGYPSAPQLGPATSDAGGTVSWSWRVVGRPVTGTFSITVSCGGASGTTQIVLS